MKPYDKMTADELREYIAQRIRETKAPELLRELIELMTELIEKEVIAASDDRQPPDAA